MSQSINHRFHLQRLGRYHAAWEPSAQPATDARARSSLLEAAVLALAPPMVRVAAALQNHGALIILELPPRARVPERSGMVPRRTLRAALPPLAADLEGSDGQR